MSIFKNIILIAALGLAVLFAGCAGTQETKISETAQPTPAEQTAVQTTAGQTPVVQTGYQIQVTEVKPFQDCIVYAGTKQSCSKINLEVKNNDVKSADIKILKNRIALKDGRALEMYENEAGLSNLCVRSTGMGFKLNVNGNQNVGLCYPSLHKADSPVLNVEIMIDGARKEYSFDLIKYGVTD